LTNITGTGIESARTFTRLLTNVGAQISEALRQTADDNKIVQQKHVELAELDIAIDQDSKPTVEVEELTK
jgi:hypothetical protein